MAIMALHSAQTGLSALNTELDVIANNLANVNTTGFKKSRVNFEDLLYQQRKLPGVENANGDRRPIGLYVGLGVKVSGTQLDFREGAPVSTERSLDLLIKGPGFFQVEVEPDRAEGGLAYTRNGAFTRNADGELVLASDTGRRLIPAITIPDDATAIDVDSNGEVFYMSPGDAEPQSAGVIELAAFVNPQGLAQLGETLFAETGGSGPPLTGDPGESGLGTIESGFLEGSNVDPTMELVKMIRTQRAFEMNSQTIRTADETLRAVAQLRR
jgi:flagellar basal-body rod protein FlgG